MNITHLIKKVLNCRIVFIPIFFFKRGGVVSGSVKQTDIFRLEESLHSFNNVVRTVDIIITCESI